MPETSEIKSALNRRLRPLYLAAFLQSCVFWYTIEKLFMHDIGFSDTGIGVMIAVYSAVMLLVETPSGLLADRWSRKGVLMLASGCLGVSGLVGGLSHHVGIYLIAAVFWGIFFACYSGMYDTIIYDCIAEAKAPTGLFDSLYGRIQSMDSAGLVVGGLAGGLVAQFVSLPATYFISIPTALVSILLLMRFDEPKLHKQQVMVIATQISQTWKAVWRNPGVLPIITVLVVRAILAYCIFEFSQLWLLALHTPAAYYGVATAVLLSSIGVGGILTDRLRLSRYWPMVMTLLITLVGCAGLILFRSTSLVVAAQFAFAGGLVCVEVIFSRLLHDYLSPGVRAGAASATSTIGRFFIIPTALLIGYVSQHSSIYQAAYILLALTLVMSMFVMKVARGGNGQALAATADV